MLLDENAETLTLVTNCLKKWVNSFCQPFLQLLEEADRKPLPNITKTFIAT